MFLNHRNAASRRAPYVCLVATALAFAGGCDKPSGWQPTVQVRLGFDQALDAAGPIDVTLYNGQEEACAGPPANLAATLNGAPLRLVKAGGVTHSWNIGPSHFPKRFVFCEPSIYRFDGAVSPATSARATVSFAAPSGSASCVFEGAFAPLHAELVTPKGPQIHPGDHVTVAVFPANEKRSFLPFTAEPISLLTQAAREEHAITGCVNSIPGSQLAITESDNEYSFTMPVMCPGPATITWTGSSRSAIVSNDGAACSVGGRARPRSIDIEVVLGKP